MKRNLNLAIMQNHQKALAISKNLASDLMNINNQRQFNGKRMVKNKSSGASTTTSEGIGTAKRQGSMGNLNGKVGSG